MRKNLMLATVLLCAACSPEAATTPKEATPAPEANNMLHITRGGIALPDTGEAERHWSEFTINLVDGSQGYGWTSEKAISFPHELKFELAGPGKISGLALDSTFAPVAREDGSASVSAEGSPVRRFTVLGATQSPDGPYFNLFEGEAAKDKKTSFKLDKPVSARWIKLVVNSNWNGAGLTRLSEFEVHGDLKQRGAGGVSDVSGYYTHEYGPIVLRQDGDRVYGCYNNGSGRIEGVILGRTMRLGWLESEQKSVGAATLVAAKDQLYGFWYRDGDRMGSPWNATKVSDLAKADLGTCRDKLYPKSSPAQEKVQPS